MMRDYFVDNNLMVEKTLIKGKDKDLESSIAFMQGQLAALGFDIEEVSWLNPVEGVYSVHIRDKNFWLSQAMGRV